MNTNCLKGMKCPGCESDGPFEIVCNAIFVVSDEGTCGDDIRGDIDWEDDAYCSCVECGTHGDVLAFRIKGEQAGFEDYWLRFSTSVLATEPFMGWKAYSELSARNIYWFKEGAHVEVFATPGWVENHEIPVDVMYVSGSVCSSTTLRFVPTDDPEADAKRYCGIMHEFLAELEKKP